MENISYLAEIFRPVYLVAGIISFIVLILTRTVVAQLEKRVDNKLGEQTGWLTRHNKEITSMDKRIDDIEKSTYEVFNLVSLCKERDQSHRDLCDERHKDKK